VDALTSSIVSIQQARVMGEVQISVARKIFENQKMQGNAALELLEAADFGASRAGDQLAVAATGLGTQLDVTG